MLVVDNLDIITKDYLEKKYIELNKRTDYNYNYLNLDWWNNEFQKM